jgi:hypothetical protein
MMRRAVALLLAAVLLLATAACSGDDGDPGGADAADASSTTSSLVFTGDREGPFCRVLRDLAVDTVLEDPSESAEEVEAAFTHLLDVLHRAADAAPPELTEDTALLVAGIASLDDALRPVGYDYDALAESDQGPAVAAAVNDPAFGVAGDRIEAYKHQVCGI